MNFYAALTGGGLALVGAVIGVFLTGWNDRRIGRRNGRRLFAALVATCVEGMIPGILAHYDKKKEFWLADLVVVRDQIAVFYRNYEWAASLGDMELFNQLRRFFYGVHDAVGRAEYAENRILGNIPPPPGRPVTTVDEAKQVAKMDYELVLEARRDAEAKMKDAMGIGTELLKKLR